MYIKLENLTPFGLFLAHKICFIMGKWPLVRKSSHKKLKRQFINLEFSHHNLCNELNQIYEKESERFTLPQTYLREEFCENPNFVKLTLSSATLNYIVDKREIPEYTTAHKKVVIEHLCQKFAKELGERYVNELK
jgi:hypothetical protein